MKLPVLCDDAAEDEEDEEDEEEEDEDEEEEETDDLSTAPLLSSTSSRPNVDMKICNSKTAIRSKRFHA
jgi:hypothetical protein